MRKIFFIIILLLSGYLVFSQNAKIDILLNPLDCKTCSGVFPTLESYSENITIYIPKRYESEKEDIVEANSLKNFAHNIVFTDSVFANKGSQSSTVNIYANGNQVTTQLKNASTHLIDSIFEKGCVTIAHNNIKFSRNNNTLFYKNLITDQFFKVKIDTLLPILLSKEEIKKAYEKRYNNEQSQYELVKSYCNTNRAFCPKIKSVYTNKKGSDFHLLEALYLDTVINGHDSMFEYFYSIIDVTSGKHSIINTQKIHDSGFYFSSFAFALEEDLILALNYTKSNSINPKDYKTFARFVLNKEGNYDLVEIYDFSFPKEIVDYNIKNNFFYLLSSNDWYTYPMAQSIFDLNNKKEIAIPFQSNLLLQNKNIMNENENVPFIIYDFYFEPLTNSATVLYLDESKLKILIFDTKTGKKLTEKLLEPKSNDNQFSAFTISQDGKKILYKYDSEKCIRSIDIEELPNN